MNCDYIRHLHSMAKQMDGRNAVQYLPKEGTVEEASYNYLRARQDVRDAERVKTEIENQLKAAEETLRLKKAYLKTAVQEYSKFPYDPNNGRLVPILADDKRTSYLGWVFQ